MAILSEKNDFILCHNSESIAQFMRIRALTMVKSDLDKGKDMAKSKSP